MKVKRFENGQNLVEYTFNSINELTKKVDQWKKEFRDINQTDRTIKIIGRDKSYERYCEELDDLVSKYVEG